MTVENLLHEVKALPPGERFRFFEELHRLADTEVPQDFWNGLNECGAGRVMEMEEALHPSPQFKPKS